MKTLLSDPLFWTIIGLASFFGTEFTSPLRKFRAEQSAQGEITIPGHKLAKRILGIGWLIQLPATIMVVITWHNITNFELNIILNLGLLSVLLVAVLLRLKKSPIDWWDFFLLPLLAIEVVSAGTAIVFWANMWLQNSHSLQEIVAIETKLILISLFAINAMATFLGIVFTTMNLKRETSIKTVTQQHLQYICFINPILAPISVPIWALIALVRRMSRRRTA